jgi:hypothetical protein
MMEIDILKMAVDAGITDYCNPTEALKRFAWLVSEECCKAVIDRERCAYRSDSPEADDFVDAIRAKFYGMDEG